jgi:3-deoxy-D-manno-octulosonic-acid transferase
VNSLLRIPYAAAWTAVREIASLVPAGESKIRRVLSGRTGLLERYEAWAAKSRDSGKKLLWMHAPSVGEGLQALPVLQLIRARRPDVQIAYTFFSPSAERFARGLAADFTDYLPFDIAGDAARAISALRPDALVYGKLDIWPVITETAASRGVRVGVISATLPATSRRSGAFGRELLGDAYRSLDAVGAISAADADRFADYGVERARIQITGDTRYDQVWDRAKRSSELPVVRALRSDRPTLVAGSTWPSDERRLLPAWLELKSRNEKARLIIAPHEISETHVRTLLLWARAAGLSAERINAASAETDVIVVDRIGILGDLYAVGHAAFIGGGFHSAGLHSVLEPAAFGIPVVFGPRNERSADAAPLAAAGGGAEVRDRDAIVSRLSHWLGSRAESEAAGARAMEFVKSGLGAAERSFALVSELLDRAERR